MTLEAKKYELIKLITGLDDEVLINKLEALLNQLSEDNKTLLSISKPIKDKLDIDKMVKNQNYTPPSKDELDKIINEIDLEESVEELLESI